MPRQDYSLPSLGPLPKLAPPPAPKEPFVQDPDLIMVERDEAHESDSDSDYDMMEDQEILNTMGSLAEKVENLVVTSMEIESAEKTEPEQTSSNFVDLLLDDKQAVAEDTNMTLTANGAPTFSSTGDARLDFFFEVLRGTEKETIQRLAKVAWESEPLDTLKLVFHLRSILHGKGERKEFYTCLDYLRKDHPRTLLFNLRFIPDHGYWKDLLNWIVFECREDRSEFSLTTRAAKTNKRNRNKAGCVGEPRLTKKRENRQQDPDVRAQIIAAAEERNQAQSILARKERLAKTEARLERARSKFQNDPFYRALHLEVARLFANALVRDKARLAQGLSISLAAKWCPSLNQFHDEHTLIASTIAQILYPERLPNEDTVAYVNRVRQLYRKEYYVPLRRATPVLETMMTSKRWSEIEYSRVPARAMRNNKEHFEAHDKERFEQFLNKALKGETTIAAQALMPHDLVTEATQLLGTSSDDLRVKTMEAQWKSYVEKLAKTGKMNSVMAMCDVSGSMSGQPLEVAIALSLLLAQLSHPPFNRLILTFSANPKVHRVPEGTLMEQVASLRNMEWGMNTDLAKAFDRILKVAVRNRVPQEGMVKTLFVFSDMEFDSAVHDGFHGNGPLEPFTNYNVVKKQFEAAGYVLPRIVFWNLAGSSQGNKPTKATQEGVAMVSGFSGMLMKLFLDGTDLSEALHPVKLMEKAIAGKEYGRLRVVD
ncbi:hypothetical protein EMPS_09237 [Entomortierella parvispora]|uniref:VWFA domain-containing protein n=1 Tax=Entomortierella parvispora TaxID=205924 RepID=A0A9P3HI67_9FUNG|nr:hypothetical protein EMPS_09237 [Entomortierella parvispora]